MKALFAHGLKFFEDSKGDLYLRGYDTKYWNRYLKHFDTLYVLGRKIKVHDDLIRGYDRFQGDNLIFVEVPDIHEINNFVSNNRKFKIIAEQVINNIDVIISRIPGTYSAKIIEYAKRKNKPYIVEMVGCPWDSLWNHSFKGKIVAPFIMQSTKRILREAPYVIYVTNKFLQTRYPTNGEYTNCSNVTLPEFDDKILVKRFEKIRNNINREILIGTTAAVDVRYKGQQYVIKALAKLKSEGIDNYRYQLVGGGNIAYLANLAKKYNVENQIDFLGAKPHKEVFEWLDNIDIYIQPSRQEGLPRALIEAMGRGLSCIGAATGGIPELLDEKYIFSNSKKNIDEIILILKNLNRKNMEIQAIRNYEEAKKYDEKFIEARRSDFIEHFLKETKRMY